MILLDTHVVLWSRVGDPRVGPGCGRLIERALREARLATSAFSFWEIAMLHEKGRIDLGHDMRAWRTRLLEDGLVEIPVDGDIAIRANGLTGFHADPADRLIVATALGGHTLVTADERILSWSGRLDRLDARR
ncbi:MAG: type II toxin-antitoxin system VapC family toxin [Gemmatimonadota bacterium]|nr:type II toxin-antitoxin system VapC family toxin [Gemmatimonadota bacterium]MDE2871413.1 type II toxin-antitoxin system VapC family toxin [Gemmatimonadota bacterium]